MQRYRRPIQSLIAALVVHAAIFAAFLIVRERAPSAEDWRDRSPRMEFTVQTVDAPKVPDALPVQDAPVLDASEAKTPPPRDRDAVRDEPARVVFVPVPDDAPAVLPEAAEARRDDVAAAAKPDASAADARTKLNDDNTEPSLNRAQAEQVAAAKRQADAAAASEAEAAAAFAPTPRKVTDRSLLARVLRGAGRARMPERFVKEGKAPDGPLPSDKQRAEAGASKWAAVAPRPRQSRIKKLVPGKEGGYRYVDADTGEAIPDDTPAPVGDTFGPRMADNQRAGGWGYQDRPWGTRPFKEKEHDDLQPTGDGGYAFEASGFSAKINRDGSVVFDENLASIKPGKTAPIWGESDLPGSEYAADYSTFSFDATDALMRLAGKDPYVTAKLRFLDDTRLLREDMRANHRVAHVEKALVGLRRQLDAAWHNVRRTGPQRRRVIFELWDECSDGPEGAIARDFIITFVNAHLPADSVHAYSTAELEMFNGERASGPAFSPYA